MRNVAIMDGGDWNDASCYHLAIPDDMNIDEQKKAYREWKKTYKVGDEFFTFTLWLRKHGAVDSDVEEIWED